MLLQELFDGLFEARKNPSLNPKISAYEQLIKYKDNPNIFISFTEINKIGINPLSNYATPMGIYTYPLSSAWKKYQLGTYKTLQKLPFATNHPYVQVLEYNHTGKFVDVSEYNNLESDISKIKSLYPDKLFSPHIESTEVLNIIIDQALDDAMPKNNEAAKFFNVCRYVVRVTESSTIIKRKESDKGYFPEFSEYHPNQSARNWNTLLRKLGYAGFSDNTGLGIIHTNEPIQAFFTSTKTFNHLETIQNRETVNVNDMELFLSEEMIPELIKQFHHLQNQKELAKKYATLIKSIDIFKYNNYQIVEFCKIFGITLDFFDKFEFYALHNKDFADLLIKYAINDNLISPSLKTFNIIIQALHNFNTPYDDFLRHMFQLTRNYDDRIHKKENPRPTIWMKFLKQSTLVNDKSTDIIENSKWIKFGSRMAKWMYNGKTITDLGKS